MENLVMNTSVTPVVNPLEIHSSQSAPTIAPKLLELGLHTPDSLDRVCAVEKHQQWILEGLISQSSVNFVAGDSGLGKSPLLYQLGICVAAKIPWLGLNTDCGKVIYVDLENGEQDSQTIRNKLVQHLKLPRCPENFLVHFGDKPVERLVQEVRPSLVIIDSLRAYKPDAEEDNTNAGNVMKMFRDLGRQHRTAFVFIHHVKKPGKDGAPYLGDTSIMQWLNQACGARALVNQSDFRLGIDAFRPNFLNPVSEEAALIIRGHRRVRGEFGPIHLARCFDDDGEAIGYRKLSGIDFLNADQRLTFDRLPPTFTFKEAMTVYGRKNQATHDFLKKCEQAGLVGRPATGKGYKRMAHTEPGLDT
jgi:AAA domain